MRGLLQGGTLVFLFVGMALLATIILAQEDGARPPVQYLVGRLEVVPPGLRIVVVDPPLAALDVGATMQYTALGEFTVGANDSEVRDISSQVFWVSMNPDVVVIDPESGIATGIKIGVADIAVTLK